MASNTASTDTTTAQTVNLSGVTGSSKSLTTTNTTLLDTDSNITYTGSAVKDTITLVASSNKTISITDSVTDTVAIEKDALVIDGTAGALTYTNLSVSGIEELTVNTSAATVNASAFSDKTIAATLTTALTLTGTAGNDVIDLSKFTHAAAATNLVINAGAGNDTIVGTAGTETINGGAGFNTLTGGAELIYLKFLHNLQLLEWIKSQISLVELIKSHMV
jgi:Ca2+-binding RTX toxin-like protein